MKHLIALDKSLIATSCFVSLVTSLRLHSVHHEWEGLSRFSPRDELMASYSSNTANAHKYEKSYRAYDSVSKDSFYTAPENATNAASGMLLKVEKETNTSLYIIPPTLPFLGSCTSPKPLVALLCSYLPTYFGHILYDPITGGTLSLRGHMVRGTSDSAPECAPFNVRNLWHHFQAPYQLALLGYVVVATDYAGLGVTTDASGNSIIHEYITDLAQANDVFYFIPAPRKAFPELSEHFVVIGSSEGGSAAWAFAQRLATEPMAGHLGTIALSPLTRMLNLPHKNQSSLSCFCFSSLL